jgi:glutamate/tyrosine decarboxylase-like PLP-dependent enzyme
VGTATFKVIHQNFFGALSRFEAKLFRGQNWRAPTLVANFSETGRQRDQVGRIFAVWAHFSSYGRYFFLKIAQNLPK